MYTLEIYNDLQIKLPCTTLKTKGDNIKSRINIKGYQLPISDNNQIRIIYLLYNSP